MDQVMGGGGAKLFGPNKQGNVGCYSLPNLHFLVNLCLQEYNNALVVPP